MRQSFLSRGLRKSDEATDVMRSSGLTDGETIRLATELRGQVA
jgi:hypothetical protein